MIWRPLNMAALGLVSMQLHGIAWVLTVGAMVLLAGWCLRSELKDHHHGR